jgi:cytochrome c551/c552
MQALAIAAALAAVTSFAQAEGHGRLAAPALPVYQQECGACHVAYPPGLLPAPSWRRITANLARHFGSDASLDAVTAKTLTTWLVANAGTYRRASEEPPQDRITRSAWFVRKHDEVPAAAWRSPAVKNPSNCAACHQQAIQGDFDEDRVRIPR